MVNKAFLEKKSVAEIRQRARENKNCKGYSKLRKADLIKHLLKCENGNGASKKKRSSKKKIKKKTEKKSSNKKKILNEKTGRYVKRDGKIGKEILALKSSSKSSSKKVSPKKGKSKKKVSEKIAKEYAAMLGSEKIPRPDDKLAKAYATMLGRKVFLLTPTNVDKVLDYEKGFNALIGREYLKRDKPFAPYLSYAEIEKRQGKIYLSLRSEGKLISDEPIDFYDQGMGYLCTGSGCDPIWIFKD